MCPRVVLIALAAFVLSGCGQELALTSPTPTVAATSTSSTPTGTVTPFIAEEDTGGGGSGGETTLTPVPPDCSIPRDVDLVGYRLVQTSAIASPLPDPTGITADSTGFWVLTAATTAARTRWCISTLAESPIGRSPSRT